MSIITRNPDNLSPINYGQTLVHVCPLGMPDDSIHASGSQHMNYIYVLLRKNSLFWNKGHFCQFLPWLASQVGKHVLKFDPNLLKNHKWSK